MTARRGGSALLRLSNCLTSVKCGRPDSGLLFFEVAAGRFSCGLAGWFTKRYAFCNHVDTGFLGGRLWIRVLLLFLMIFRWTCRATPRRMVIRPRRRRLLLIPPGKLRDLGMPSPPKRSGS